MSPERRERHLGYSGLRWVLRDGTRVLQQCECVEWTEGNAGGTEERWMDVPVFDDGAG